MSATIDAWQILIESQWNLNASSLFPFIPKIIILIESQWNLNDNPI